MACSGLIMCSVSPFESLHHITWLHLPKLHYMSNTICIPKPFWHKHCCMMLRRAPSAKMPRASPEISVATIEGSIEEWLSQQRTRDLSHLIADLSGVTWKSSPKCGYLPKFAPLCEIFAKFAANGVLPTKKTSLALVALHGKMPINFTAKSVVD